MFGELIEYTECKRCGNVFGKMTWNNEYCPDCKRARRNERCIQNYHRKHGGKARKRATSAWSDYHRFQFYMDKTWESALCPICGKHMSVCSCSESDPDLREYQPARAETWAIWGNEDVRQYMMNTKANEK